MTKIIEIFGEPISHGGQEAFGINVVKALDNIYKIDFYTPYYKDNKDYEQIIHEHGGNIYADYLPFNPGGMKLSLYRPVYEFLLKHKYDIAHINSGSTFFLAIACKAAKNAGVRKVIVHSHSSGEKESIKHFFIKKLASPIFNKCADQLCATSLEAAKWKYPKKMIDNNLIIVKNGIDVDKYRYNPYVRESIRKQLHIDCDTIVIGHVGRFTEEKNQAFLVNIFAKWVKIKNNSRLILVGDGEVIDQVKNQVSDLGIDNKVTFIGAVENVENYLQAFDIFVFPSKFEGLGIAAIEAQAAGLPVVASDKVPHDIAITKNVAFVSLDDDGTKWCDLIKLFSNLERIDQTLQIKQAGFDLVGIGNQIRSIYNMMLGSKGL